MTTTDTTEARRRAHKILFPYHAEADFCAAFHGADYEPMLFERLTSALSALTAERDAARTVEAATKLRCKLAVEEQARAERERDAARGAHREAARGVGGDARTVVQRHPRDRAEWRVEIVRRTSHRERS